MESIFFSLAVQWMCTFVISYLFAFQKYPFTKFQNFVYIYDLDILISYRCVQYTVASSTSDW